MSWRDRAPAMLRDTLTGPDGEPCFTTTDRRWLWRLEGQLAVCAPMGGPLDELRRDLREYLNETCEHHWQMFGANEAYGHGAGRQCLWCCDTEFDDEGTEEGQR